VANKKLLITCVAKMLLLLAVVFSGAVAAKENDAKLKNRLAKKSDSWVYVVQMNLEPALNYKGNIAGYKATKPKKGGKFDARSAHVKKYRRFLESKHDDVLKKNGIDRKRKIHDYSIALNGFAVQLTNAQAIELAKQPGIAKVKRDVLRHKTTDNSPSFLGLNSGGGPWNKGITGENVVVGIIDTGIWPEHPSFSDDGSYGPSPIPPLDNARANCDFGNVAHNSEDAHFTCNNKLLGARQMLDTYRALFGADGDEFESARDDEGHGTHTASTAAGNADVDAAIFGIARGKVSGIAARARIIAYKGLGKEGGFGSDLAAAIEQAIADGVDVINYSVGGGPSLTSADDIAFLLAADAGVYVATSAGNEGPDPSTIGGPASVPWVTSVAASSQSRAFISEIEVEGPGGAPTNLWGSSVTQGIDNFRLVDADSIGDGSNGECKEPFPPGTFSATDAVLCNRYLFGVARTDRVANVAMGGGGAVIFYNVSATHPNMMPTDSHPLPTIHVLKEVGQPLKEYVLSHANQVKIKFSRSEARYTDGDARVISNYLASFSSRGPNPVALDIIKPDVTAPGINIMAAASPMHNGSAAQGEMFQSIMGTSMSSPQVAGIFALIKQAHPEWSPAMAKSALMTTAYQQVVKPDYITPADPFDVGAGHVNPGAKANRGSPFSPGLVYDASTYDYLGFLCDADRSLFLDAAATCAALESAGIPTKAINLNLASVGVSELTGIQTVTRRVTNVSNRTGITTYSVAVEAPDGYEISVIPSTLKLRKGESASYDVTITNVNAPMGDWRFGALSWYEHNKQNAVRSPIALRASILKAPTQIDVTGESGSASFSVQFGYAGGYTAAAHGLQAATINSDTVAQDPDQAFDPSDGFSNAFHFDVSNALFFRLAMPPEAVASPDIDIDIYVFNPNGELVAASTNGGTDELIDIKQPMDGTWTVFIHGWQTVDAQANFDLYSWVLSKTPGGNLQIDAAPSAAVIGAKGNINVGWNGAALGQWQLGAVSHNSDSGIVGTTLVNVDNR